MIVSRAGLKNHFFFLGCEEDGFLVKSHELFAQGYNCGQSVFLAHAEEFGLALEMAQRLAAPLGAGLGGLRRTCGALTALCLLAGLRQGAYDPNDREAKTWFYALIQRLDAEFTAEFGTSQCAQLLADAGCEASAVPSVRTAKYYAARPCARCIEFADRLYERHLACSRCHDDLGRGIKESAGT